MTDDRKQYALKGIPNDTLTSDIVNERSFKVSIDNLTELYQLTAASLVDSNSVNKKILEQLRLLNNRFEEAFNTKISEIDND